MRTVFYITILQFIFIFSNDIYSQVSKKKEKKLYENAILQNNVEGFENFLEKYPDSEFSFDIRYKKTLMQDSIEVVISTYLGNEKRNFYGNKAPSKLDTLYKIYLGEGNSPVKGKPKIWKGAGWTGQPLYIREKGTDYLIQPSFDYNLKKIEAKTGKIVWEYKFDDILKGSPTLWVNTKAEKIEERYVIIQGSRLGLGNSVDSTEIIPSLRAVSYISGKELWRLNVKRTHSYSRDVDGSALVWKDTAYLALENGIFTVFSPDVKNAELKDGILQPKIYKEIQYFNDNDIKTHERDLVSESSPAYLNDRVFTPAGSGHIYGYNIKTGKNDFDVFTGTDMNGSSPVTDDNCIIVALEKQYVSGQAGVMKLNPQKPAGEQVEWFFPTENLKWYEWEGGIIGSASVNDFYAGENQRKIAVFIDVCGVLYVVEHNKIENGKKSTSPDGKTEYLMPKLLFKEQIVGTISTPIIVEDKIIAATDKGIYLYKINLQENKLELLDKTKPLEIDSTPIAVDGKVYIACRNGYLYCFGEK